MKRLLPYPWMSVSLFLAWLALNVSLHPAHLLLGAGLALALPILLRPVLPELPRMRRPDLAMILFGTFMVDVVKANIQVALLILGPTQRIRPGFIWIPLDVREPGTITVLAGMITMTPGTLSSDISPDHKALLVHVMNLGDANELIADIKRRYEAPLKRIFEGTT